MRATRRLMRGPAAPARHAAGPARPTVPQATTPPVAAGNTVRGAARRMGVPDLPTRLTARHAAGAPVDPSAAVADAVVGLGVPLLLAAVVTSSAPGWSTYTVRRGDTLSVLADRYGIDAATLARVNDLPAHGNLVLEGQRLRVPARTGAASRVPVWHTVRPGDTVWALAQRHRTHVSAILRVNRLRSTVLHPGQRLRVGRQSSKAAAASDSFAATQLEPTAPGVPSRSQMRDIIARTARAHGVDPALALAISWQEAGWKQSHVSASRAIGAMQVLPSTGQWISGVIGRDLDLRDPRDNATAGVVLLKLLLAQASERVAVAGYYQGLASVRKNGMYPETRQYVANVMALKRRMG